MAQKWDIAGTKSGSRSCTAATRSGTVACGITPPGVSSPCLSTGGAGRGNRGRGAECACNRIFFIAGIGIIRALQPAALGYLATPSTAPAGPSSAPAGQALTMVRERDTPGVDNLSHYHTSMVNSLAQQAANKNSPNCHPSTAASAYWPPDPQQTPKVRVQFLAALRARLPVPSQAPAPSRACTQK